MSRISLIERTDIGNNYPETLSEANYFISRGGLSKISLIERRDIQNNYSETLTIANYFISRVGLCLGYHLILRKQIFETIDFSKLLHFNNYPLTTEQIVRQ